MMVVIFFFAYSSNFLLEKMELYLSLGTITFMPNENICIKKIQQCIKCFPNMLNEYA